jgi:hypothetical protein
MTKQDILNNLRKPVSNDPTHKWIGSYNSRQIIFHKFFRWLYNPDEADPKKRMTPPCMVGIRKLPRQEKSPYKPSSLWDAREHAIFLKYCPSKRDRCYHAMANDMSARPHEILNLKIKDILFKVTEEGNEYAEVLITGGKTRPRTLPLIDSIPYVKEWIEDHPTGTNPESWLFVSLANNTYGLQLTYDGLSGQYKYYYKTRYFPRLLEDRTVRGNRAKMHAERMARGDITFLVYPSGKVVVTVACSNNPFKIETDQDLAILFSFLGQVRDRLMRFLDDPRERTVPHLLNWILSQCDFNKDIEITDKVQITLPDIQLKYANEVFRMYVKSLGNKAMYREEHSLKLGLPLIEALDNIRHPYKSLEEKIDRLNERLLS